MKNIGRGPRGTSKCQVGPHRQDRSLRYNMRSLYRLRFTSRRVPDLTNSSFKAFKYLYQPEPTFLYYIEFIGTLQNSGFWLVKVELVPSQAPEATPPQAACPKAPAASQQTCRAGPGPGHSASSGLLWMVLGWAWRMKGSRPYFGA